MRCFGLIVFVVMLAAWVAPVEVAGQSRGGGPPPSDPGTDPMLEWRRQWWAAMQFIRENSPQRAAAYEALPRRSAEQRHVRGGLMTRYRTLQEMKEQNPALYELGLERLRLEDEVWGLGRQIRTTESEQEKKALAEQMEPVVRKLVENHFSEREYRIERLRQALAREEQRLSESRSRTDEVVRRQMERIIRDETFLLAGPVEEGGDGGEPAMGEGPEEGRGPDGPRMRRGMGEGRGRGDGDEPDRRGRRGGGRGGERPDGGEPAGEAVESPAETVQ